MDLDESYWTARYEQNSTGWDIGSASPPITHYMDGVTDKNIAILIPGCGNAYEAKYLWENGFRNTYLLDISQAPLAQFKEKNPEFPDSQLLHVDFFEHQGKYDIIIEQTFFCALNPVLRSTYVSKMHELLKPEGKLVGVLFDDPLFEDHPPFGGDRGTYEALFTPLFKLTKLERCYNSITPRQDREFFITFQPKEVAL